jgi:Flp pilus assembly protein TadG
LISNSENGTAAVELVMIAPALILLLAVIMGAGRLISTKSALESVAREAGRIASSSPDGDSAQADAKTRASDVASGFGLDSDRLRVSVETGDFGRGQPLSVSVTYPVNLADLPAFGLLPGSFAVSARHVETAERYGSR